MEITAPAKINLYLKVVGEREDGYHEIETLFERISIFDRISIEPAQDQTILSCNDPRVPVEKDSLLWRIIRGFRKRSGNDEHFRISVEKNIPIGAGLGGGSSDAAALLKGLNQITGSLLEEGALMDIARKHGADIPFFMSECSFGFGTGRGDIIKKSENSPKMWHVLVCPPFAVSTKDIYSKVSDFCLTSNEGVDKMFCAFLSENDFKGIAENLRNDLQDIVLRDFPNLNQVFSELQDTGAEGILLTGSGPTVFGIFDKEGAERSADMLSRVFPANEGWQIYIAHTC